MNRLIRTALVSFLVAGCAATGTQPSAQPSGAAAYSGEVWTWDERDNTVTLRQGTQTVRIKVTPDQLRGLRPHQFATVRGEIDPPAPIPTTVSPAPPMAALPSGAPESAETTGTISTVDPKGLVSIDSPRGRLVVWTATPPAAGFQAGAPVRVRTSVQPLDMVPLSDPRARTAMREPEPAASAGAEPGDHAVITGRVLSVDPNGLVTVESPRGPVTVMVGNASKFQPGMTVQLRTIVQAAS